MQYSPKLKKAIEQIKEIIKANDIAGIVVLHTVEGEAVVKKDSVNVMGFTEFLFHINPSYSAARIENDRFRVKGKKEHYNSQSERDVQIAKTVNMFDHLSKCTATLSLQTIEMSKMVNAMVEKDSKPDNGEGFTSHSQQNN